MSETKLRRRLSAMDAFFLYVETPEQPMNVGAVCIFQGKLPFQKVRRHLDQRLHLAPRYRQRVLFPPGHLGLPTWEEDPDFSIEHHMTALRLEAPGDEQALQALASDVFTGVLDRDKPLWELYVVEGLAENESALIMKVHHCMVDGVAGVSLALLLLDLAPTVDTGLQKQAYRPKPLPEASIQLCDGLLDSTYGRLMHWKRWRSNYRAFSDHFDSPRFAQACKRFASTVGNFLSPLTYFPFNRRFSGARLFTWASFSFTDARTIRASCGGTLNDVILTVLALAMRQYLHEFGEELLAQHPSLRVLIPVNIRREEEQEALGNRISFLPVEIPLDLAHPVELLHAVKVKMADLKKSRVGESVALMMDAFQGAPAPLQAAALGWLGKTEVQEFFGQTLSLPPANMLVTNVPGPQIPLYCQRRRLLSFYPLVPATLGMGVNLGVMSYDQRLHIALTADGQAGADAQGIMRHIQESFETLRAAAAVQGSKYIEIERNYQRATQSRGDRKKNPGNGRKERAAKRSEQAPRAQKASLH